ncbi:MAG: N-acetylmuramoyl-L-alanine amidase [Pseudomonadota bacterium]
MSNENKYFKIFGECGRTSRALLCTCLFLSFVMVLPGQAIASSGITKLKNVRFGVTSTTKTRIVVDLQGRPEYVLKGVPKGQGELIIEFTNLGKSNFTQNKIDGRGIVADARYRTDGTPQLFVSLEKSARVAKSFIIGPSDKNPNHRLVIDLERSSKEAFLKSVKPFNPNKSKRTLAKAKDPVPSVPTKKAPNNKSGTKASRTAPKKKPDTIASNTKSSLVQARDQITKAFGNIPKIDVPRKSATPNRASQKGRGTSKYVVAIDAGHGGRDPGAIGPSGLKEKNVTISAARVLKAKLEKTGRYVVILTRPEDKKVAYANRIKIAREAGAELFISLHADAIGRKDVRGASVYTLSEAGTARSALEAREQGDLVVFDTNVGQDQDVQNILFDLAQAHTVNESDRLAETLVRRLNGVAPLLNNSHREGNLAVLLAPDVPAVLLELGFISNASDERNLNSPAWRDKTMTAVAQAIDEYFARDGLERQALSR